MCSVSSCSDFRLSASSILFLRAESSLDRGKGSVVLHAVHVHTPRVPIHARARARVCMLVATYLGSERGTRREDR